MTLGTGAEAPWENCEAVARQQRGMQDVPTIVAAHRNLTYIVHRRQYAELLGYDLLTIKRQDETDQHPGWRDLQAIKDRLVPYGTERFGVEIFPPRQFVVDNCDLWHVWVYPIGEQIGFGFHPEQIGGGLPI